MPSPHLTQNLCTTPLKVGGSYLDTWGRRRTIEGHVHVGHRWPGKEQPVDPNRVYCNSCHYDINTGIATDPRVKLVNLPPAEEIAFFEAQIELIKSSNPPDKLKLVQDGLDNMEVRIMTLKSQLIAARDETLEDEAFERQRAQFIAFRESFPKAAAVRVSNVLCDAGIEPTKEAVKLAMESGRLQPGKRRNYGAKTDSILREWAGVAPVAVRESNRIPQRLWKFHPITGEPYTQPPKP